MHEDPGTYCSLCEVDLKRKDKLYCATDAFLSIFIYKDKEGVHLGRIGMYVLRRLGGACELGEGRVANP